MPVKSAGKKVPVKSTDIKFQKRTLNQLTAITEYMKTSGSCTAAELCNLLEVKERRVRQLLKCLEEDGRIEIIGTYRNRRYKLKYCLNCHLIPDLLSVMLSALVI